MGVSLSKGQSVSLVKQNGGNEAASIKMSGTYFRQAGGAPVNLGADDNTAKLSAGWVGPPPLVTAALVINGNAVEVQVSPPPLVAVTLDWRLVRTQTVGAEP